MPSTPRRGCRIRLISHYSSAEIRHQLLMSIFAMAKITAAYADSPIPDKKTKKKEREKNLFLG